jgi:fatty-acyl-CoA synthase
MITDNLRQRVDTGSMVWSNANESKMKQPRLPNSRPLVARTLGDLLLASAERWPDSEAVVFPSERITYAELARRAWEVSRSLSVLGVQPGQNVGLLMTNCAEFIVSLFGIAMLGAVAVPVNARYRSTELAFLAKDADLVVIMTTGRNAEYVDFVKLLQEAIPGLSSAEAPEALQLMDFPLLRAVIVFGASQYAGTVSQARLDLLSAEADEAALSRWCDGTSLRNSAAIIYTSGTTSSPRGAILTHEALVRAWMMVGRRWSIGAHDRFWNPGPLFHIAAIGPLIFTLGHGATFITDTWFEPTRALQAIESERATMLYPAYPPITQALLSHPNFSRMDLSSVKAWLNVAPPETLRRMSAALPSAIQISTYGSTEGGPVVMHELTDSLEDRLTTCGHPLPGNEVRVVDPITGVDLTPGLFGEIIYRGYNTFSGYYKDPVKTATTIDAQGWVHTGDLGKLDDEGRLLFSGRLKEMLKVGGENVSPTEVEEFLATHPAVKLVQVIGIPDARLSEVVAAYVELHQGFQADESELVAFCRGRIASFKVPRLIRFVSEWPLSATKIQRSKLRDQLIKELGLS